MTTPQTRGLRPPLNTPLAPRPALLRKLGEASRWFITAPAGTGKTALAQLWQEKQSRKLPAIWIDLADLPAEHSIEAACLSGLGLDTESLDDTASISEASLIVDHLDRAHPAHLEQLEALLTRLPEGWKLILISRSGPPRAAWILRFDLRVLGSEALWWEEEELAHWLREQTGMSRRKSQRAARWLGGWIGPAALYARAQSAGIERIHAWIYQFLQEEIIEGWPESTRAIAARLAWLPALGSPWLEALPLSASERQALPCILEHLTVFAVDGPYGRQLHPLLTETLTQPGADWSPPEDWLDKLDQRVTAVEQPLPRCGYLTKRHHWKTLHAELVRLGHTFLKQGYHLHVLTFLDALPDAHRRSAEMVRLRLWALFYADRRDELAREIRRVRAREDSVALPEDELTLLDMMTRSPRELGRGQAARDALERLRHQSVPVRSVAFFGLATAYYWQGALEDSETLSLDALTHAKLEGRYSTVLSASGLLLWLQSIRGETIRARNLLKDTDIWLEDFHAGSQAPHLVSCWRNSARVRLHALQGDLQQAWQSLSRMKRYISGAEPAHQAMTCYAEALWHLYSQQADTALPCLDEAQSIIDRHGDRFSIPAPPVEALRVKCLLQLGRLREAREHLRPPHTLQGLHPFDRLEWLEASCLFALFDGQRDVAHAQAQALAELAREHRFLTHHITARAVQACLLSEDPERLEAVRQCVEMAASNDLVFPMIQFRPFFRSELSTLANDALLGPVVAQLQAYNLSPRKSEGAATTPHLPAETLSRRELEVLGLIADGLANKEIAARLHLAGATVKAHIRNIYGKIGARNRTEAVRIAQDAGLIAPEATPE